MAGTGRALAYQLQRRMAPGLCQRWWRALALVRAGARGGGDSARGRQACAQEKSGAGRTLRELRSTPPHVQFARSHATLCPPTMSTRATAALAASHHISAHPTPAAPARGR
eukprot:COSAG02_NODE_2894_length_7791_cov_5.387415_2_plen_111_part_00